MSDGTFPPDIFFEAIAMQKVAAEPSYNVFGPTQRSTSVPHSQKRWRRSHQTMLNRMQAKRSLR